jgi:hypothetical protein
MSDSNQAIEWYLARDGQQHGPVSDAELRKIVELGYLKPTDLVWRQGWADWKPATVVLPAPAAPYPPAPQSPSPTPHVKLEPEPQERGRHLGGSAPAGAVRGGYVAAGAEPGRGAGGSHEARQRELMADQYTVPSYDSETSRYATRGIAQGTQAGGGYAGDAPRGSDIRPHNPAMPQPGPGPAPASDEDDERGGLPWRTLAVLVLLASLAGGGYALWRSGHLANIPYLGAPVADGRVPVVAAPGTPDRETPRESAPAPAATKVAAPEPAASTGLEDALQRSPLWKYLRAVYPTWYKERLADAARLSGEGRDPQEVSATLMRAVVELRRKHNADALRASPAKLKAIAVAFVENLGRMARHSTAACYGFISQGETSPALSGIGSAELRASIDAQLTTIFEAVAEGQQAPVQHEAPRREDYDALTGELSKLGWSTPDLQLFADPRALARAAPEKVCQMVNDWFTAQLAVKDEAVQTRLLSEALKPVVAG